MALLDGGLRGVFGAVFGPLFLDGTLHVSIVTPNGQGGYTITSADYAIKGMVDTYSDGYRASLGIPDMDARLIVLQHEVAEQPTLDSEITLRGVRYKPQAIEQDPAQAAWVIRSRPV